MKKFMDADFLLSNETAKKLFHGYAENMPLCDYHCHLSPKEIWENKPYSSITQVWLGGDHYKWRAMRAFGIDEKYITGSGSDKEKFLAWAKTIQYCIGNPLYHWTHLELQRFFGIYEPLTENNAEKIYEKINAMLSEDGFCPRDFIEKSDVAVICTTDDPKDNLEYHKKIAEEGKLSAKVLPTFRPDKAVEINREGFAGYISELSEAAKIEINSVETLKAAISARIEYFHAAGCRISDHGMTYIPYRTGICPEDVFKKALAGQKVTFEEEEAYKTEILLHCGREYSKHGWAMQIHINAIRNNNSRMFKQLGPDTGFDSIHDLKLAENLSGFLDALEKEDNLPKTIFYSLNPNDNYVLASMMGNFQGGLKGKMQLGSAWWFNDHRDGMEEQMKSLANVGLLSCFVGMLTDSRSFLSYPRHEYFRRIFCNILGEWVENGEYPYDEKILADIVKGVCFNNAMEYFGF
jgi:glucuronate isomerase